MKPEPRLRKRTVRKADGRYLIFYERAKETGERPPAKPGAMPPARTPEARGDA